MTGFASGVRGGVNFLANGITVFDAVCGGSSPVFHSLQPAPRVHGPAVSFDHLSYASHVALVGASLPEMPLNSASVYVLARSWRQLDELRRAARASKSRWLNSRSSLMVSARMEFLAALTASRARRPGVSVSDDVGWAVLILSGQARFAAVRRPSRFSFSSARIPHCSMLFGGALAMANGWPWTLSIRLFSALRSGWLSADGLTFWTCEGLQRGFWSHMDTVRWALGLTV